MNIFGFGTLKNGVKYDYPFVESLSSLKPLCQSVAIALGDSEDTTGEVIKDLSFVETIPTVWDSHLNKGGLILSQQTNIALSHLRGKYTHLKDAWGIYLQADEVLHEKDYELIKEDLEKAEKTGCDAISFRYFHFWLKHDQIAVSKRWYPQEIRAIKLNSEVKSWGDAQSFKNMGKVYQSDAFIYHYGHVRESQKYSLKKSHFLDLYIGTDSKDKHLKKAQRNDSKNQTLPYLGRHPQVMSKRIECLDGPNDRPKINRLGILGNLGDLHGIPIKSIGATNIEFLKRKTNANQFDKIIDLHPNLLKKMCSKKYRTPKMQSKLYRPWPKKITTSFKFYVEGIPLSI